MENFKNYMIKLREVYLSINDFDIKVWYKTLTPRNLKSLPFAKIPDIDDYMDYYNAAEEENEESFLYLTELVVIAWARRRCIAVPKSRKAIRKAAVIFIRDTSADIKGYLELNSSELHDMEDKNDFYSFVTRILGAAVYS